MNCEDCTLRVECLLRNPKKPVELEIAPTDHGVNYIHHVMSTVPEKDRSQLWWLCEFLFSFGYSFHCDDSWASVAENINQEKVTESPDFDSMDVTVELIKEGLERKYLEVVLDIHLQ